jgi:hypothetical protein
MHRVSIFKEAFCNYIIECNVANVEVNTVLVSGE